MTEGSKLPKLLCNGRFELVERLGHGAEATVFRARDGVLDETIVCRVGYAGKDLSLFRKQYKALVAARSFSLARPLGFFEDNGLPVAIGEFIAGVTLADWLADQPLIQRLGAFAALTDATGELHRQGISHGDIHPQNVIIAEGNRVVLIDPAASSFGSSVGRTPAVQAVATNQPTPANDLFQLASVYKDLFSQPEFERLGFLTSALGDLLSPESGSSFAGQATPELLTRLRQAVHSVLSQPRLLELPTSRPHGSVVAREHEGARQDFLTRVDARHFSVEALFDDLAKSTALMVAEGATGLAVTRQDTTAVLEKERASALEETSTVEPRSLVLRGQGAIVTVGIGGTPNRFRRPWPRIGPSSRILGQGQAQVSINGKMVINQQLVIRLNDGDVRRGIVHAALGGTPDMDESAPIGAEWVARILRIFVGMATPGLPCPAPTSLRENRAAPSPEKDIRALVAHTLREEGRASMLGFAEDSADGRADRVATVARKLVEALTGKAVILEYVDVVGANDLTRTFAFGVAIWLSATKRMEFQDQVRYQ